MVCPKCGSNQIQTYQNTHTETHTTEKGYGCIKGCLGYILFNIPGLLCGFCGSGKHRTSSSQSQTVDHVCQNCGNHF